MEKFQFTVILNEGNHLTYGIPMVESHEKYDPNKMDGFDMSDIGVFHIINQINKHDSVVPLVVNKATEFIMACQDKAFELGIIGEHDKYGYDKCHEYASRYAEAWLAFVTVALISSRNSYSREKALNKKCFKVFIKTHAKPSFILNYLPLSKGNFPVGNPKAMHALNEWFRKNMLNYFNGYQRNAYAGGYADSLITNGDLYEYNYAYGSHHKRIISQVCMKMFKN